ncbi:hypothetical protein [Nonomuraea zeae]|uniref:Integral membrane protein n=1 Tax=Nonomuraea zeae TaxID=1642303 RepID=A0A5S4G9H6_9ACTN|nr:hypothetical protein [Nonomuraea zeae]TMR29668.1 hypothetical protein ETD85_31740 [Nonomuraea zeae]
MDKTVPAQLGLIRKLFMAVAVLAVATLVAAALLRDRPDLVNWVVWVRGGAVALASLWLLSLVRQAGRGRRSAYVRIRVISALAPIGALAILVAPDSGYPMWMKADQGVIGLLLAGVAVVANQAAMRRAFVKPGKLG